MRSHPDRLSSTVALNALWCLLIALALLSFPILARQARLHSPSKLRHQQVTLSTHEPVPYSVPSAPLLVTHDPSTPPSR